MKRELSYTINGLKFAMEKNDFERPKSSSGKKRNDFGANPINIRQNEHYISVFFSDFHEFYDQVIFVI